MGRDSGVNKARGEAVVLPSRVPQLDDLSLLLLVQEYGSVGKAARVQNISQPAASIRISAMERCLGLQLLNRSSGGSQLTEKGEILAKYARNVTDSVEELLECGADLQDSETNQLRVACSPAIAENLIPEWVNRVEDSLGESYVEVQTGNADSICELARACEVDVAFIDVWNQIRGDQEKKSLLRDLVARHIWDDQLAVLVGSMHSWITSKTPLTVQELESNWFVLRERGSGVREFAEEFLQKSFAMRSLVELPSNAAVKHAVATGQRATVLNISSADSEIRDGRLHQVAVEKLMPTIPIYAVWSRRRRLKPYARELVEIAASQGAPVEHRANTQAVQHHVRKVGE